MTTQLTAPPGLLPAHFDETILANEYEFTEAGGIA